MAKGNRRSWYWKVPVALIGVLLWLALLLLSAVVCVVCVPSLRQTVLDKGVAYANEYTEWDIDLGRLYLSPFHHSPMVLYGAYKGENDLPLTVEIDSLFVGHRGQDTLIYVHALRLKAVVGTSQLSYSQKPNIADFTDQITALPIVVDTLGLEDLTFHSDSMIAAVGIDVIAQRLALSSPRLSIAKGEYPLHGLRISDADIAIDLRDTPVDTTAQDTTPLLMAFDVPDGELRNVRFRLTPLGMDIHAGCLSTNVLADVGGNIYDARRLDVGHLTFALGDLSLPADTIYGNALVDLNTNQISSGGLYVRSNEIGATADLDTAALNLETMRADVRGRVAYQGLRAGVRGYYDIDDEAYDMSVDLARANLGSLLDGHPRLTVAGTVHAQGQGIDPMSKSMRTKVRMYLKEARYEQIDVSGLSLEASLAEQIVSGKLHLPFLMADKDLQVKAQTDHQFRLARWMSPEKMAIDYHGQMRDIHARVGEEQFDVDHVQLDFATDQHTALDLTTEGLRLKANSPMHVMKLVDEVQPLLRAVGDSTMIAPIVSLTDLSKLDDLRRLIPAVYADLVLTKGSPIQYIIEGMGLDINEIDLLLQSDAQQTLLVVDASIPDIDHPEDSTALRLPAIDATLNVEMTEGRTHAKLAARSKLTDGAMALHDLRTDAGLELDLERIGSALNGAGRLTMYDLHYGEMDLGSRTADLTISPSERYAHSIAADVRLDEIPLELVDSILKIADMDLEGAVLAKARVDGLPGTTDISAEVHPIGVRAEYKPYKVALSLGETPIVMQHNKVDLNGLPIYGADSTYVALTGGLDLNTMKVDVVLAADSFAPTKLPKDGPIPVYGDLATDIRGRVTGPLDTIVANVDVTLLPSTDITYPIDKKNLAQVKPHGTVHVRYGVADGKMDLGGRVDVDDGTVKYSPKFYPIMPFKVDSGSHVLFDGPLGNTRLNVSASQQVKADVESADEETRRVDFRTGGRVNGVLDSLGLQSIGFFMEAPEDEEVTRELASLDEETREGLAATLLGTGMYVGESNMAAQRSGYALSSIINSRLNAAMANSKMGKVVDIDISSAQTTHAAGKTNDMNISISKSFFKDRLRITIGSTITDNPEVNTSSGLLANLSADYKLTKEGNVLLRLFAQRDYNNVLEGELHKYGLGVRATKDWRRQELYRGDSIWRVYGLTADAGVAYRSNNSIGPDLTLKSTIHNLLGRGETFTLKGNGAYYWALRDRYPGDPKKTDTYKLGVNASLVFPYLHWLGDHNPEGDTRYMLGYQYENIAGGYGVHKMSGSLTYFIHSPNSPYITHAFTPFSLSVVRLKAETDSLMDKALEYPQLMKVIASDEFVPSIGYNLIYDDYRSKRAVNTYMNLGVKESGNLINAIYCIFGHKWNEEDKPLGKITFNQFVKVSAELRNKYNLTDQVSIATRLFAGANIPLGNSMFAPLSEAFYTGGPNSYRAASPYAYGPGNFHSAKYNQSFFHSGDVKLEANFELRFPIVWKLYGAAFVDAGNVWNWFSTVDLFKAAGYEDYLERMEIPGDLKDGVFNNPDFARQIALGTGAGLRLDIDGLVVRLDIGVGIHAPYQTYRYDENRLPDYTQPIETYFNMPSALDAIRLNFGIGYPF